jgi:STE24 endopeptidase
MQASFYLTVLFAAALLVSVGLKFWLTSRQVRHVTRHRAAVPAAFRETTT